MRYWEIDFLLLPKLASIAINSSNVNRKYAYDEIHVLARNSFYSFVQYRKKRKRFVMLHFFSVSPGIDWENFVSFSDDFASNKKNSCNWQLLSQFTKPIIFYLWPHLKHQIDCPLSIRNWVVIQANQVKQLYVNGFFFLC